MRNPKSQVVPVCYYSGSYGSAVINLINAHRGFHTTFARPGKGRAEGGCFYTHYGTLCHFDDPEKEAETFDIDDDQRIAARMCNDHMNFTATGEENIFKSSYSSEFFDKVVMIDVRNSSFIEHCSLRSHDTLANGVLKTELAKLDFEPDNFTLNKILEKKFEKRFESAEEVAARFDNAHLIHFDKLISESMEWYYPLCEYLEVKPFEHPERYWHEQFSF
ncbi:MAG: hypothetical protein ACR2MS_06045 [Weeksellaceae bacterium]